MRVTRALGSVILLLLAGCEGPYSTLDPAGPGAERVALLWWGMFAVATVVFFAVVMLWWLAVRREATPLSDSEAQRQQNRWVLWGGFVLPLVCILTLLAVGLPAGQRLLPLPGQAVMQIEVTGHQWWWEVHYPDHGITLTNEVRVPAGEPVDFVLYSGDVIHSFWVPQLGRKLDMIPGHRNVLRLQADEPGVYHGQCAEFCGVAHAHMRFELHADEPAAFAAWLDEVRYSD